jgi:sigma-B regulation protein RsbU (phosphoserine phosphatase)
VPLGSFAGVTYDELSLPLQPGDLFVFCTDGLFEAADADGAEFGAKRICEIVQENRTRTARQIVDAIFEAVASFRGSTPPGDDMTAVAVKITG